MAKKRYPKQHSSPPQPLASSSLEALEARAREDLAAGKFRKARDAYKLLCKQDRDRFLPGLIEANTGLMEDLTVRGLLSEAEQVMAYLKTIAPPAALAGLDVRAALRRADWAGALASAAKILAESPSQQQAVADALVLAFEHVETPHAPALPERVKSDLTAVTGALECLARADYETVQDLLRPLPRESLFADWKMLIKGMAAFHTGDIAKAEALLSRLPENGVPAQAAAAYRALASRKAPRDEAGMERVCRLFDADGLGSAVSRADRLWRRGDVEGSYMEMRKVPDFPSEEPDLPGALSDFYFKCFSTLREILANRCFRGFHELLETDRCKNDAESRLISLALLRETFKDPDFDSTEAENFLRQFLLHSPPGDAHTRKMAAIAFEKLGSFNASMEPGGIFGLGRERMVDSKLARKFLLESIDHDPDYLPAYLKLAELYDFLKKTADRNRLLDDMTRRFPNDKAVLIKAGVLCSERKAYVKGIEYLERARALDPLDRGARAHLATAYIGLALQDYEKRALAKARNTYELLFKIADRENIEPALGLDFLLARQSVLERIFGEPEAAARQEAAAREAAHSKPALLYFLHSYFRVKAPSGKPSPFWDELQRTHPQNALERLNLLRTFISMGDVCKDLDLRHEAKFIEHSMEPLLKGGADVNEILELVNLLPHSRHSLDALTEKLIAAGLKGQPGHPGLRFRKFILHPERIPDPDLALSQLEALQEDAARVGDTQTEKMTGELIKSLGLDDPFAGSAWLSGGGPFDDDDDDDEDEDDFADGGNDFDVPEDMLETLQSISSMGPAELQKLRRELVQLGMPEGVIDDLLENVRSEPPPKSHSPHKPPRRPEKPATTPLPKQPPASKTRPPKFDDNQPELF